MNELLGNGAPPEVIAVIALVCAMVWVVHVVRPRGRSVRPEKPDAGPLAGYRGPKAPTPPPTRAQKPEPVPIGHDQVLAKVAEAYGVTVEELTAPMFREEEREPLPREFAEDIQQRMAGQPVELRRTQTIYPKVGVDIALEAPKGVTHCTITSPGGVARTQEVVNGRVRCMFAFGGPYKVQWAAAEGQRDG